MKFPYARVELTSDGSFHDRDQVKEARRVTGSAHDVLVLVHGWKNDIREAESLYERLTDSVEDVRGNVVAAAGRRIAVVGVLWPSIKWADHDELAGGGASADGTSETDLIAEIGARDLDSAAAAEMQPLIPKLNTSKSARQSYLQLLRRQLPDDIEDGEDAPPLSFLEGDVDTVFEHADEADGLTGTEMAEGGGAGFFEDHFVQPARNLLNLTTYYTMRERAGKVGARGIASVVDELRSDERRIHLVGHSFGARAVSSAANTSSNVHALVLLQGAFSHYGFAQNWNGKGANGVFRAVPGQVQGPIVVTHTKNDKAVGQAYAIASRLAQQVAVDIGGPSDRYGGIGRNGALKTPEALTPGTLQALDGHYAFRAGKVSNLQADTFISGHSAVTGKQVAYALLTAATTN
ncbi:alpha/beta fold hydrolase [Mycolicibacterium fluoranthenivorans]|uniref:Alpha/beta hydrolase n=1 Tax=Mycolicibacterium fluoranthenivorans TaxID=258505 RepID=A0A1G4WRI4_9MYCO|nr:hypothetical protein [Mycolicibacterium fluoranthenivorans]SCX28094.1 hypothetical protein SAMN02799620_04521 [Mycolicibacterium fluoranthenivorans]